MAQCTNIIWSNVQILFGLMYKYYLVRRTNIIRSNVQILFDPTYKYYSVQCTNIIWSNVHILFGPMYKYSPEHHFLIHHHLKREIKIYTHIKL
jgi:hypothetical protein